MGSFEAHYNRWGIPFDFVWAKLSDNKTFTNFPGYTANPTAKEAILTPKVTYLVVDGERVKIKANGRAALLAFGREPQNYSAGRAQHQFRGIPELGRRYRGREYPGSIFPKDRSHDAGRCRRWGR